MTLLSAHDVSHTFRGQGRPAVRDVNVALDTAETVALVGESGCGKSTLGRIMAGLLHPTAGVIRLNDQSIDEMGRAERKTFRRAVQIVQQDPFASLNPSLPLRTTLGYAVRYHGLATRKELDGFLLHLLDRVGLEATGDFLDRYPHQLSGGQRQRIAIARAVSVDPAVIVADEAVSMLDVSMRVALLDLLLQIRAEQNVSFLFISHDFGVVRYFAAGGRIIVMFYGVVVEEGATEQVINRPQHPYTYLLLQEIPVPDPRRAKARRAASPNTPVDRGASGSGCVFAGRCPFARDRCRTEAPPLTDREPGHASACWYPELIPVENLRASAAAPGAEPN